jgi:hypothetical protein
LALAELRRVGYAVGVDSDPGLITHGSFADGIVNAVAEQDPSFVLVGQGSGSDAPALGGPGEAVAASIVSPVAVLIGDADRIREVVLLDGSQLAAKLASRIGGKNVITRPAAEFEKVSELAPGQLAVAAAASWERLSASDPSRGAAVVMVFDTPPAGDSDDRPLFSIRDARM